MSPVTPRQKGYHRIRRLHHRFRHTTNHQKKWWNRFLNTSRECHSFASQVLRWVQQSKALTAQVHVAIHAEQNVPS